VSLGVFNNRILLPAHRVILEADPQRRHVGVMLLVGIPGLASGVYDKRVVQVAQVHDYMKMKVVR
jgi:hypothetical protein